VQVVFFGDNVPKARVDSCLAMIHGADSLLVVGSSLMTMSAFRLIRYMTLVAYECFGHV
jgi:NAD-dependent deacetylase sirtuin 4